MSRESGLGRDQCLSQEVRLKSGPMTCRTWGLTESDVQRQPRKETIT